MQNFAESWTIRLFASSSPTSAGAERAPSSCHYGLPQCFHFEGTSESSFLGSIEADFCKQKMILQICQALQDLHTSAPP